MIDFSENFDVIWGIVDRRHPGGLEKFRQIDEVNGAALDGCAGDSADNLQVARTQSRQDDTVDSRRYDEMACDPWCWRQRDNRNGEYGNAVDEPGTRRQIRQCAAQRGF